MAISEIEDESVKIGIVEATLQTVKDDNLSELLSTEYNCMNEKESIESIIRVIRSGNAAGVKAAKEAYLFVTGEEYVSAEAARAWLEENYVPPELDKEK